MKKKIIIFIFIFGLILVSLIIPNEFYMGLFKEKTPDKVYVDSCYVYLLNEEEKLVGVNVPLENKKENEFITTWSLLTTDVPNNYTSPIYFSTQVISNEVADGVMNLNLSADFNTEVTRKSLECLAYNFCKEEVSKIQLQVEGTVINEVDGVHFDYLTKDIGVNVVYEYLDILNSTDITVIYEYKDYQMPVTYYVDETIDVITFLVEKSINLLDEVGNIDYSEDITFELSDTELNINVADFENFNTEVLNTLKSSISGYYDLETITINGLAL